MNFGQSSVSSVKTIRPHLQTRWTQHGHSSIEVPEDCKTICRDGKQTVKGADWVDTVYQPANKGNKVVRLLPDRDAYHMAIITCYRAESMRRNLLESLLCASFGLLGVWFLIWLGYNLTGVIERR